MNNKDYIFSLIGYGPTIKEQEDKKILGQCFMTEIVDGEEHFCCNNKSIYNWVIIDGKMRQFKIPTAALCGECYKKINEKYGIEFDIILPYHFQNKNFELLILKNHKKYKLIKQIYEKLNIINFETFQKNCNVNDVNSVIDSLMNPEKIIWTNVNYLCCLPKYWFENFELYDFLEKKTKNKECLMVQILFLKILKIILKLDLKLYLENEILTIQ